MTPPMALVTSAHPSWTKISDYAATLGPEMVHYWRYHKERFLFEVDLMADELRNFKGVGTARLLDIGPSFQTLMFEEVFGNRLSIDTGGFADEKFPPPPGGVHVTLDLNDTDKPETLPQCGPYDLVTCFEVIEHVYVSPLYVLKWLHSIMRPGGSLLLSTPNAVTLLNRIKLLLGQHPFEKIRLDRTNPGHFREYTRTELIDFGSEAGFEVKNIYLGNLSSSHSLPSRVLRALSQFMPPEWRKEITVVFSRRD